jgi:hypothetical protein
MFFIIENILLFFYLYLIYIILYKHPYKRRLFCFFMGAIRFVKEKIESSLIENKLKSLLNELWEKRLTCPSSELRSYIPYLDSLVEKAEFFNKNRYYLSSIIPVKTLYVGSIELLKENIFCQHQNI